MRLHLALVCAATLFGVGACGDDTKNTSDTTKTDTADTAQPDTADTAEPDTAQPDTADTAEPDTADTGDTVAPANFACLGTDPKYPTGSGLVEYDAKLVDYVTGAPIAGSHAKWCKLVDPLCASPIYEATSDADGIVPVKVPASFDGFIEGEGGGIMPVVVMADPPRVTAPETVPLVFKLITPSEASVLAGLFNVTLDPTAGHLVLTALDCDLAPTAGAVITVSDPSEDTLTGYLANGLPSPDATATDASGAAGIFNLTPGWHTVRATTADGKVYGRGRALIQAGAITQVTVTPMQTTPDLSCAGQPDLGVSYAGDVAATWRVIDFATRAPVAGAHIKACDASDGSCAAPLAEADTDGEGLAHATIAFTEVGFDGFLEITGADLFPTRLHFNPPVTAVGATDGPFLVQVLTPTEIGIFAQAAHAEIDPELAHVAMLTVDCKQIAAHGISVTVDPTTPKTTYIYVKDFLPAPAATATDDSGTMGIFDVPVGVPIELTGMYGESVLGRVSLTTEAGFLYEINIMPSK